MTLTRALVVLLLALHVSGCSEDTRTRTVPGPVLTVTASPSPAPPPQDPHVPAGSWATTLGGVRWHVPAWPDLAVGTVLRASAALEIDNDPPPAGWSVIVVDPGAFSTASSPTGLAVGATKFAEREIYVAWCWPRVAGAPLFPAYAHEVEHARTGNPCAGHPGCTLAPTGGP